MKKTDEELLKMAHERVEFKRHLYTYLIINAAFWLFWIFSSSNSNPWPIWVTLGWGIGIASHYIKVYVRNSSQVQKEYEKLKRKEENH